MQWERFPPALRQILSEEVAAGNVEAIDEMGRTYARARPKGFSTLLIYISVCKQMAIDERARWERALAS